MVITKLIALKVTCVPSAGTHKSVCSVLLSLKRRHTCPLIRTTQANQLYNSRLVRPRFIITWCSEPGQEKNNLYI